MNFSNWFHYLLIPFQSMYWFLHGRMFMCHHFTKIKRENRALRVCNKRLNIWLGTFSIQFNSLFHAKKIILKFILKPHICHDANFCVMGDITKTFSVNRDDRFRCRCLVNYIETLVWLDSMKYTKPPIKSVQKYSTCLCHGSFRILILQVTYLGYHFSKGNFLPKPCLGFNSLRPNDAYMLQIMTCRLSRPKPLFEPLLG